MKNNQKLTTFFSRIGIVLSCFLTFSTAFAQDFEAQYTSEKFTIDGLANEESWQKATWYPLQYLMAGSEPSASDFQGRFKLLWNEDRLYLQAEIVDDVIFDQHADPLYFYWDDDCLEIFIDEDHSGGDHQFNFNAFAYHVSLDNQAIDIGESTPERPVNFIQLNDHLNSVWRRSDDNPHKIIWEVELAVYDKNFTYPNVNNEHQPVKLVAGKRIGFMLAYCDNDGSEVRESFVGSTDIKAVNGDKNLGYKTADVFDTLVLKK